MTIVDLNRAFSTEEKCREYLCRLRWPEGIACPRCAAKTISTIRAHNRFECSKCRYQFTATAGTIFHDSHLPLEKWFLAAYLMCESRKGVSANQLKRVLGTSYKTAWYLCHRIRAAMKEIEPAPLGGTVEVDETYIGGRRRMPRHMDNKTMVLGAIQRGGQVRLKVEQRPTKPILRKFLRSTTGKGLAAVYSDERPGYKHVIPGDTPHETVNHSAEEWVRGNVHTNTIEGVFSLFKRSIVGAYHQVSAKHLDAYLDEFEFRFNRRNSEKLFEDTIKHLVKGSALTFRALVVKK